MDEKHVFEMMEKWDIVIAVLSLTIVRQANEITRLKERLKGE